MEKHQFRAVLVRPEGVGTWTYLNIPLSVEQEFGKKGQVRVRGTVNCVPFRSTLMPQGNGVHYLVVNKCTREQAHAGPGDTVQVELEYDGEVRELTLPVDFVLALQDNPDARAAFDGLSYSHQKEFLTYLQSAKRAETRQRRLQVVVNKLAGTSQ